MIDSSGNITDKVNRKSVTDENNIDSKQKQKIIQLIMLLPVKQKNIETDRFGAGTKK